MKNKKNKKGQMAFEGGIFGMILSIVLVGGLASILTVFMASLSGQVYETTQEDIASIGSETAGSEQFRANNVTATQLTRTRLNNGSLSLVNINGTAVALANFTVNYSTGTILLGTGGSAYNNTLINASYTYDNSTIRGYVNGAVVSAFSAQQKGASYIPLLILAGIVVVVVGAVLSISSLATGSRGNGGSVL